MSQLIFETSCIVNVCVFAKFREDFAVFVASE